MISREEELKLCHESEVLIQKSGYIFTAEETASMVSADFGLSRLATEGIQVLTFINTERIGAKVIVNLPGQTMVEHWHPTRDGDPGKEETLRCLWGSCRVYVPGEDNMTQGYIPEGQDEYYKCRHEIILKPTEQYTFAPGVPHWFQPGEEGSVILSMSTLVTDQEDMFTNPNIDRITRYSN